MLPMERNNRENKITQDLEEKEEPAPSCLLSVFPFPRESPESRRN